MWIDDEILIRCQELLAYEIWQASSPMVVLGRSNEAQSECYVENCQADGIPIVKRYGGGGTVLLYPGTVVVSLGTWVRQPYHNRHYFALLNGALIETLAAGFPIFKRLEPRGLSDIADSNRKIVGTSMFRSRNYLLYQASLLVDADLSLIERYLRHPSLEPEYRRGKSHREFLRNLCEIDREATPKAVEEVIKKRFATFVSNKLADELIDPIAAHCLYLLRKSQHY